MPRKMPETAASEDPRANMQDGQTAPGFEAPTDLKAARAQREAAAKTEASERQARERRGSASSEAGAQESYLAPPPGDAPPGFLMPPSESAFANATWLRAGPEIRKLVDELLRGDELKEIRDLPYAVTWRRKTKPTLNGDEPRFASVEFVPDRVAWEMAQREIVDFPRFWVDVHWQWFQELREEGQFVHPGVLQQHLHHSLMGIALNNDHLSKRSPITVYAETVKRFGQWNSGVAAIAGQLALWPSRGEG